MHFNHLFLFLFLFVLFCFVLFCFVLFLILFVTGTSTVYWNGRDRENKPVPGGRNYRAKIAIFKPLTAKYAASLGNGGRYASSYFIAFFYLFLF